MDELTLFDMLPEEEAKKWKPQKSTDWKWSFKDYPKEKNGLKVFSCFACGGGSTMGYKLAGCEVLGCVEIDPKMNEVYVKNHHPKYNYLMDIRDFNNIPNEELPEELFHLDILDGSPPCTTFSMAGGREKNWGKEKKFREGQKMQTLDDLSFIFIDTVAKLKPKVVIMENVEGLLLGEAWSYVQKIHRQFGEIGYQVKHYLCKGEWMGVPQRRHRVFFISVRNDIDFDFDDLNMEFNYEAVTYKTIKSGVKKATDFQRYWMEKSISTDARMSDVMSRVNSDGKSSGFSDWFTRSDIVMPTITSGGKILDVEEKALISDKTIINGQTFPQDYYFNGINIRYICGMSVPPVMMKRVVERVIETGVFE